jgi:acetyltransferase-like isoleucine patch superfamily enzyme
VTIKNGCIIAAGSVVTRDVEAFSAVMGVPGRVFRKVEDAEVGGAIHQGTDVVPA